MPAARPTTPPRATVPAQAQSPLTPEQVRRMEINRLKAKALREQREAEAASVPPLSRQNSSVAGQKRNFDAYAGKSAAAPAPAPSSVRDAKNRPLDDIKPIRSTLGKYIEYDFSKMTDTKGGFLTAEDDPHNKAMRSAEKDMKPAQMTQKDWERQQLLRSLRNQQAGPFEPGISAMTMKDEQTKKCRECGAYEIDFKWSDIFDIAVCNTCKEKFPEKYSLLTKTEAREDYLLTEPELKDEKLLPHLERPNPHKSNWHNMYLYLRLQVEAYAFSDKRWGSSEALDAEFERRQAETKQRKETKFKNKLADLKKRTQVEAYRRNRAGNSSQFGDDLGDGKHIHDFGRAVENPDSGIPVKQCLGCGLEVEELEL
ncbi:DNA repair protein rad14 [Lithohypha guttulata]|nr:DNA repair protein rad14 [Lithohypha guttulata]